jgi:hypothetical protein
MPTNPYFDDEYRGEFLADRDIQTKALERALDIRKFEIDLYWKRAAYLWTFIATTLAGFVVIQASSVQHKTDMSVLLANLGIVFSFGWFCVNRGSKCWQENWEYHVDMFENEINGPLYKVVMTRSEPSDTGERIVHLLTGPSPLSVSKINQFISLFVTLMWIVLLVYSLPPVRTDAPVNGYYIALLTLTFIICIAFLTLGRTSTGGYWHRATKRTAKIKN